MGTFWEQYATAVVDQDLADDKMWQKSNKPRRLVRIMCIGSTAAFDFRADVFYGSEKVMQIANTDPAVTTGNLNETEWFWHTSKIFLPAGTPIKIIVTNAAEAAIKIGLDFQEMFP